MLNDTKGEQKLSLFAWFGKRRQARRRDRRVEEGREGEAGEVMTVANDSTLAALWAALAADDKDWSVYLILADRLEELGEGQAARAARFCAEKCLSPWEVGPGLYNLGRSGGEALICLEHALRRQQRPQP
jgi:hypothetical protein